MKVLTINPEKKEKIREMIDILCLDSEAELYDNALSILSWMMKKAQAGHDPGVMKNGVFTALDIRCLEEAKLRGLTRGFQVMYDIGRDETHIQEFDEDDHRTQYDGMMEIATFASYEEAVDYVQYVHVVAVNPNSPNDNACIMMERKWLRRELGQKIGNSEVIGIFPDTDAGEFSANKCVELASILWAATARDRKIVRNAIKAVQEGNTKWEGVSIPEKETNKMDKELIIKLKKIADLSNYSINGKMHPDWCERQKKDALEVIRENKTDIRVVDWSPIFPAGTPNPKPDSSGYFKLSNGKLVYYPNPMLFYYAWKETIPIWKWILNIF